MQKSGLATFVLIVIAVGVSGLQAVRLIQGVDLGAAVPESTPTTQPTAPGIANASGPREPTTLTLPAYLPPEARETMDAILRGGPFAYRQDGAVFQNREGNLPGRPRGYYREYTVPTPGSSDRGARRIVSGDEPPAEFFYTDDHYRSFRRFVVGSRR